MPICETALITGASSGIGQAIAIELAQRGMNLVLVARRGPQLEQLARELSAQYSITATPIVVDLAEPTAPAQLVATLAEQKLAIDWLVNNAGYGVPGAYTSSTWTVHRDFLQVMLIAVAELTHRLLPAMLKRGHGRIVNVASIAGLLPATGGHTLYGAVKAWMISFSRALGCECAGHGVTVTAVCPGFTRSEFHDVSGLREQVSKMPRLLWMDAATVARQAVTAAERGKLVYINGWINRTIALLARCLPHALFQRLSRSQSRHFRDTD